MFFLEPITSQLKPANKQANMEMPHKQVFCFNGLDLIKVSQNLSSFFLFLNLITARTNGWPLTLVPDGIKYVLSLSGKKEEGSFNIAFQRAGSSVSLINNGAILSVQERSPTMACSVPLSSRRSMVWFRDARLGFATSARSQ